MHITFFGAVREVTGSMHMLVNGEDRILLDCGMFQGRRKESAEKNRILPFDPAIITNVVLSHAHIDHSGRIPMLTRDSFAGRVFCSRVTHDACEYLLADSAHIQESDADYLNYKLVRNQLFKMNPGKKGRKIFEKAARKLKKNGHRIDSEIIEDFIRRFHLNGVKPLYTSDDAVKALDCFSGYPYHTPFTIGDKMTCTLYDAGHILGSAISVIRTAVNGRHKTVCYTGDIGRFDKPILEDPTMTFSKKDLDVDLLIMESTYGNREHPPVKDLKPELQTILNETFERGGSVLIPAFAYGRTQELLYYIHELYQEGLVNKVPIYVDSPLATRLTKVFGEHPEVYDNDTHTTFLQKGKNPFSMPQLKFVGSVEESMALNRDESPHIVLSASGMCEAGRILHHLRHKIHNPRHTILIVGFMAKHTLGRRLLDQGKAYTDAGRKGSAPMVKILNKEYPLKAHVHMIGGFSAHADKKEMLTFLKQSNLKIRKIAVVHGEKDQSLAFADTLNREGFDAIVPRVGQSIRID
ncbi:MAG: exonuclease [Desulfobacteraceae bacterium 4572_123]|nr:MAG: exonuclease [Desulfobacteraceae bacterium 4572_123]